MKSTSCLSIIVLALLPAAPASTLPRRDNDTIITDFSQITPSPDLNWVPCFEDFACTILEVPLDYADPSVGATGIAFIKKSSENPSAQDVLINPGGPGGSGVGSLLTSVSSYAETLGLDNNIVGFDPRGVNNSGPSVSCFPNNEFAGNIFYERLFTVVDPESEESLKDGFRIHGAYGDWCTRALAENNTARYANTVAVANDMLRYIETKARREGTSPEEAKLWFYGISYGTILGATYATLFPNRIARMILDGVLDTEEYYTNGWSTSVSDFDASIRQFFKLCFEAGPELCAFHKNASSPEELENRLLAIFDALRENPIEVVDRSLISPVTVTWADLVNAISISINNPIVLGPTLAQALSDLEDRNATIIAMNDAQASLLIPNEYDMRETRGQTSCLDNNGRFNTSTIDEYTAHFGLLYDQSKYGGPVLGSIVGSVCRNLNIFPPESQVFPGKPGANQTSYPILFIGNTLDPVTPLRHAQKVAATFPGAGLLAFNTTGHTTLGVTSICLTNLTKAYMADASLPAPDTLCQPEVFPFAPANPTG